MEIETLLDLKAEMMGHAGEALQALQRTWETQRYPTDSQNLIRVLSRTMDKCQREGIRYPPIFPKRKGELQRGEFQPRPELRSLPSPDSIVFSAPSHPKIPQEWIQQAMAEESIKNKKKR